MHAAAAYGRVSVMHMLLTFGADAKAATPAGVRANCSCFISSSVYCGCLTGVDHPRSVRQTPAASMLLLLIATPVSL